MENRLLEDIVATAESFKENFADRGHFDFSVGSLDGVDELLDELSEFEVDGDTLDSASSMAGCYIFEVARRNFGGNYYWVQEKEQPVLITGEPAFSVSIFAFEKARGRIVNGKEDHIPFYFEGYIQAVKEGESTGKCSTII